MSNLSSYALIDDDHIDDQETINVSNIIKDIESDPDDDTVEDGYPDSKSNTCFSTHILSTNIASSSTTNDVGSSHPSDRSSGSSSRKSAKFSTNSSKIKIRETSENNRDDMETKCSSNQPAVGASNPPSGHPDERGELKMKIMTRPGRNKHKIVAGPNQNLPTSGGSKARADDSDESVYLSVSKQTNSSSISSTREFGTSTSVGTITEPDCLGPCEPGTSVTLEGIVWQETEGGILVVNITWRGKTYVGALLDCTQHDWAPPRLCDSPTSDTESKTNKAIRPKRLVNRGNGSGLDEKNLLQTTGKLRNGKGRRILISDDLSSGSKRPREQEKLGESSVDANTSLTSDSITDTRVEANRNLSGANDSLHNPPESPVLLDCAEAHCSKKFRNANGLLYHQTSAHGSDYSESNSEVAQGMQVPGSQVNEEDACPDSNQLGPEPSDNRDSKLRKDTLPNISGTNKTREFLKCEPSHSTSQCIVGDSIAARDKVSLERVHEESLSIKPVSQDTQNISHGNLAKHSTNRDIKSQVRPPTTIEEGMKPSGTSTGPPPAPHAANYFFGNYSNAFGIPPFMPKTLFDPMAPPTSAAFFSRYMNMTRPGPPVPPMSDPMRLMCPPSSKDIPFPPPIRPMGPLGLSQPGLSPAPPNAPLTGLANPLMPPLPPLPNSMPGGSSHLRIPSHGEPLAPPTSRSSFPLGSNLNHGLVMSGLNPMGGSVQGRSVPDDPTTRQLPRRFN